MNVHDWLRVRDRITYAALTAPFIYVQARPFARPPTCLVLQALIDKFPMASCYGSISLKDNNFHDWVSDRAQNQTRWSLFDDKSFPSAAGALSYDKATHNFDLSSTLSPYLLLVGSVYGSSTTQKNARSSLNPYKSSPD
jgi:hypothetical protein